MCFRGMALQPSPPLVRPCAQPGAWLCRWLAGRLRTWLCFLECLSYREESSVTEYIIFIRNKHGLLIGKFIRFFKDERGDVKETLGRTAGLGPAFWFHCSRALGLICGKLRAMVPVLSLSSFTGVSLPVRSPQWLPKAQYQEQQLSVLRLGRVPV